MAQKEKKIPEKQDDSGKSEMMRRFKANPLLFIGTIFVLVIVIVAFVFLPMNPVGSSQGGDLNFGSYNKKPINYVEGNYFARVRENLASQYQSSMDTYGYEETLYYIWRGAFEETAVYMGILDEMSRAGYKTPDDVVDLEMASYLIESGFSINTIRQMENNARMILWRQLRDSIAVNYYKSDMEKLLVPSNETAFISSMGSPERNFDMVSFSIYSYPDSEIEAYVRTNPNTFRNIHLSRITLNSNEREARQVLASIQNGTETFENAARNLSRDQYADYAGDMGNLMVFELTELPSDRIEELLRLSRGSLSDVIRISDNSWAIFRVEETARPADIADYVIMDKIRNYMMTYQRGSVEEWLISQANDFIAQAQAVGFDDAAADLGIYKNTFGPLSLNYGNVTLFSSVGDSGLSDLNYAGTNELFWQAAFTTPINALSVPVVVGTNVIVLYPLEEMERENDEFMEWYYPQYWLPNMVDADIRSYFLNNGKLNDKFWDIFQYFIQ